MRYALIGCGRIAQNHVAAAKMNGLEIVALCDCFVEKAFDLRQKYELQDEVTMVYEDYNTMLRDTKPELVAIATESGRHAEIALDCLTQGSNVIIEKPIALSLKDVDNIIRLSNQKDLKVCVCHQNRFNKSVQKIREAIDNNKFGKLYHGVANTRWNRDRDYYAQASWRGTWSQDGGALMNQCIHNIDLLRWMMGGKIDEVMAMTDQLKHNYVEAEDLGIALIRFKNGSYGIVEGTTNIYRNNFEETLCLFGEKGTVRAGGKSVNRIDEWIFSGDDEIISEKVKQDYSDNPPNVYGYGHKPLYTDMIDAIKNDRRPYIDAEDGRDALELVLGIYKSSLINAPVKFPMESGSTAEFMNDFWGNKKC